jgi:alkaline phosphatase
MRNRRTARRFVNGVALAATALPAAALPAAVLLAAALLVGCESPLPPAPPPPPPPPNVVFFVGDGFGVGAWSLGREAGRQHGVTSVLDDAPTVGFLETRCADFLVTDSAAAATAWSVGKLGPRFAIGSQETPPLPSLFERLRAAGRAYGFVTTTRVTHGTPAPFYARAADRYESGSEEEVAEQLLANMPDVAIGGGRDNFAGKGAGGMRADGRNLMEEAREAGIAVVEEWATPLPTDRPVLALLASSHLPHELDREPDQPDLPELVLAALDRLEAETRPYFLLVEAGRIDQACHDHDGPGVAANVLRLDRAVRAVLERVDPARTLVVVTADHTTDSPTWHETAHPESLDIVSMSVELMERKIFGGHAWKGTPRALEEKALPVLDAGAHQTGLTAEDLDRLVTGKNHYDRATALGKAISRRFGISFLSYRDHLSSSEVHGHTGDPVPLRAWGVRSAEVAGIRDHAEFGRWLRGVMELPEATDESGGSRSAAADGTTPIDTAGGHG